MKQKWLGTVLILMMLVTSFVPSAGAAPKPPVNEDPQFGSDTDDAAHPLGTQQREARALAFEAQMNGKTHGRTHQVHKHHYVELEREGEDTIWTIIGEFGSQIHPTLIVMMMSLLMNRGLNS